jgi:uncharacterized repeat protein (TIGR02543 family)
MLTPPKAPLLSFLTPLLVLIVLVVVSPTGAGAVGAPVASPVSVGGGQICATVTSGAVECLGQGNLGQLGYFYGNNYDIPSQAGSISNASTVSAGADSTCALLSTGGVDCWGYNYYGELGNGGGQQYSTSPVSVTGISTATDVSQGGFNTCSALVGGTVDCWGQNGSGEIGDGNTTESAVPVAVSSITNAASVSMGLNSACAVLTTGSIDCWGDNSTGELGDGGAESSSDVPVSVSSVTNAVQVSVGAESACALLATGSIDCWGGDTYGDLGNGAATQSDSPVAVSSITNATSVSVGQDFACATVSTGSVQCWGTDAAGQLGNASTAQSDVPVTVSGLSTASAVSAGSVSACAVLTGGATWCWGSDNQEQLGYVATTPNYSDVPVRIAGLSSVAPAVIYTVTYNPDGGSVSPTSAQYTVGGNALTLPTPTLTGESFTGWYTASSGGTMVASPYTPSGAITLYARWTANSYLVTYNADGGGVSPTSQSYTFGGSALTLPTPSRAGHFFQGWYTASNGGTLITSPYAPSSAITLYAQWSTDTYVLQFDADGGTVTPDTLGLSYGAAATLPTPTFTGYTFKGWYSAGNGGEPISSPLVVTGSMTIFAQWTPDVYVVTFDANGGTVSTHSSSFTVGSAPLSLPIPTFAGRVFKGWHVGSAGGALASAPYTPSGAVTLDAQWSVETPPSPAGGAVTRSKSQIVVRWKVDPTATSYTCTLTLGATNVRKMTTKKNECVFSGRGVANTYRVSIVAHNSAGASRASTAHQG